MRTPDFVLDGPAVPWPRQAVGLLGEIEEVEDRGAVVRRQPLKRRDGPVARESSIALRNPAEIFDRLAASTTPRPVFSEAGKA